MNKNLLYIFLLLFAVGCGNGAKKNNTIFFAGEIVNPANKYVVLYNSDNIKLDSAKLDTDNRFSFQLDSIKEGLYHFEHAPEYQYIYLHEGDSIQIRLNTMDFDESLVFSGKGSEFNNFLIDLYLVHEKEERIIRSSYFSLEPEEFHEKIETLRKEKLQNLKELKQEVTISEAASEIAEVSINYNYYNYKEIYPFEHRKRTGRKLAHNFSPNFYAYRKDLSFNNKRLNYLTPYYNFVKSHLKNLSYMGCDKKCGVKNEIITNQLHFNRHKLNLIDSLIKEEELRDNLFRNVALEYLLGVHDNEKNNAIFIDDFHLRSGDNRHLKEINELYQGITNVQPHKKIPDLMVTDYEGKEISLQKIAKNKKVVFYFWTASNRRYFKDVTKKIAEISKKNNQYTFVGINYNTDNATWKGLIERAQLDKDNQYQANDQRELTKTLIFDKANRCIITNNAKIVDAFNSIWSANF